MKYKKPELLCPVGGKQQLIAAVENGADAVYLGGSEFNARMYADNFNTIDEIQQAVDYAHLRNVKVYITLNTLINDNEFKSVIEYAKQLYLIGVDALIVQDIGLINKLSEVLPDFKIHVSTQATVYSADGVKYFDKYNSIERIVLARELNTSEIEEIISNTDKEIEVFVHGALCVCYSGQCKLSSQIGARSGNRGKCAQPCRLPYKLFDEDTNNLFAENYYLSTKDICTIDILPKLVKIGVDSFKVEGRMKYPEYVAAVTRIYRKYIDKCFEESEYKVEKEDKDILLQVFNRGNFSEGYLTNDNVENIWCNNKPKHLGTYLGKIIEYDTKKYNIKIKLEQDLAIGDVIEVSNKELSSAKVSFIRSKNDRVKIAKKGEIVTLGDIKGKISKGQEVYKISSKLLNEELKQYFTSKSIKKNDIDIKIDLKINDKPEVEVRTNVLGREYVVTVKEGNECEKGINRALNYDDVKKQFSKTGDVPFKVNNITINLEDGVITALSNLNEVRRKAIEKLANIIVNSFKKKDNITQIKNENNIVTKNKNKEAKISVYVYKIDNVNYLEKLNMAEKVYISLEGFIDNKDRILDKIDKEKIWIYLPTITSKKYKEYILNNISIIKDLKNVLVTNIEHLEMFKNMNLNIYLDNSFNVFNSETVRALAANEISGISLSSELTLEQIINIKAIDNIEMEVDVYGNQQVMYSKLCTLKATGNCLKCKKAKYSLIDRKETKFPIIFNKKQCMMQILNSDKLFSEEAVKVLKNKVDYMRLYVYDESKEDFEKVIQNMELILNNKEVENKISSNNKTKYTNGHFYREV